jgi:hypothetical protein
MLCSALLLLFTVDFASVPSYLQLVSRRCHLLIPGVLSAVSALACVCLYIASVHSSLLPSLSYLTPHTFSVAQTLQLTMIAQHAVVLLGVIMLMSSFGTAQSQSHLRNAIRKGVSPLLSAGKEDDRQSLVSKFEEGTLTSIDVNALGARSQAHSRKLAESLAGSTLWAQFLQDIDGEAAQDGYGGSVALSSDGTRVAIGAILNDGENGADSGQVRVFDITGSTPRQIGQDIDGEAAGDQSGISLALSSDGSRVAIGANFNDGENGESADIGQVRVYDVTGLNDDATWKQIGQDIDGEAAGDESGFSIALSSDGSRVAIGARFNGGENGDASGQVRVFDVSGSSDTATWTQIGGDIDGEAAFDFSGSSVALSGDGSRVAIGAAFNAGENGDRSGQVRVFYVTGLNDDATWKQIGQDIDGEAAGDRSGRSVSISDDGTRVAIGASRNEGENGDASGQVRVFDVSGSSDNATWTQIGGDIDGEAAFDEFGFSVALSGDGTRVAIGARGNDGNGDRSGHARVFDLTGSNDDATWIQIGDDIDGEAAGDFSGWAVALTTDGSRVAIGAIFNDGNGERSGQIRLYDAVVRSGFLFCLYTEPPSERVLISRLTSPASF